MKTKNLQDLLVDELKDIYFAEKQLTKALPKMAKAATNIELKQAFENHADETREHVARLEKVFEELGVPARTKKCPAILGIIEEGTEIIEGEFEPNVKDAGLIAAGQRAEHYEMAVYGSIRAFAETLGHSAVVSLLTQTLEEEGEADHKLSNLAEGGINQAALDGNGEQEDEQDGNSGGNGKRSSGRARMARA